MGRAPVNPVRVLDADDEPCCVCGEPTAIYVRIDPKLSDGLAYARRKDPGAAEHRGPVS